MKTLAILGATGHIGKALSHRLSLERGFDVFLFARSPDRLERFIHEIDAENKFTVYPISSFGQHHYDVVINCVGTGKPFAVANAGWEIFRVTEEFDNLILNYLKTNMETLYINMSSGAVYGNTFHDPVDETTKPIFDVNPIRARDNYAIAKINSEAKHRSLPEMNIIDLRVFSFFSRFIDVESGFLITEIIKCIKSGALLITTEDDIIRDYISSGDLLNLILLCIKKKRINDFFDVYSRAPITKMELLRYFHKNFGLKFKIQKDLSIAAPTGAKRAYYTKGRKTAILGYAPTHSSLSCIVQEIKRIL